MLIWVQKYQDQLTARCEGNLAVTVTYPQKETSKEEICMNSLAKFRYAEWRAGQVEQKFGQRSEIGIIHGFQWCHALDDCSLIAGISI